MFFQAKINFKRGLALNTVQKHSVPLVSLFLPVNTRKGLKDPAKKKHVEKERWNPKDSHLRKFGGRIKCLAKNEPLSSQLQHFISCFIFPLQSA